MKTNRSGKSPVLNSEEYIKIRQHFNNPSYQLVFDIAWFTGERWGAIRQLKVNDVYTNNKANEYITFRARTRKARPNGKKDTRQAFVNKRLAEILNSYKVIPSSEWLFPGLKKNQPICFRTCSNALKAAAINAGLGTKGISTHSTRRSMITNLHSKGVSPKAIQSVTGHKDIRCLAEYIEFSEEQQKQVMELVA